MADQQQNWLTEGNDLHSEQAKKGHSAFRKKLFRLDQRRLEVQTMDDLAICTTGKS